jgi:pimeloyl-ACP methyl ester carboxylesterase
MKEPAQGNVRGIFLEKDYWTKLIATFPGQIMLVHGELDDRKAEEKYLKACQKGRLHVVRGASHMVHLEPENRGEFNTMIREFAKDVGWKPI